MLCLGCGAEVRPAARFCERCGLRVQRACPGCAAAVSDTAAFCHVCGRGLPSASEEPAPLSTQSTAAPAGAAQAERRQATILFCDLVDSTKLAASLDPEDLRQAFGAFRDLCVSVIKRHQGFVAQYLGDGVLVFFGYPQAHEDDAERAARAGLELAAAAPGLHPHPGIELSVRVGIATGLVVVGDPLVEGSSYDKVAVGGTTHLAHRMQSLAQPGEVVISAATRRLVGDLFDCVDLGPRALKGFAEPVSAWLVVGETAIESRFAAAHSGVPLTPLAGRADELETLLGQWQVARQGSGQLVALLGEPGIGKSRLTRAFLDQVSADSPFLLQYFCAPRFQNTALFPVIRQLGRAARLAPDDPPELALKKLEKTLAWTSGTESLPETVPLVAALLSIPFEQSYTPITDPPERQKDRTLATLRQLVHDLARKKPVVLLFEDLHWADPTTLDLVAQLAADLGNARMFLLATSRLPFQPPWAGLASTRTVELARLNRESATSIVSHFTGGKTLPDNVLRQILDKSDGIPLFLEELTKTVLESRSLEERADHYAVVRSLPAVHVPSTLHDSLMERLDKLPGAREVVQVGAAIGREFSYELLVAVAASPEHEVRPALDRLVEADLVYSNGTPPQATYTFKHALIQDAAHATMLRPRRQRLHAQIAQTLEKVFPDTAKSAPELLAHHLAEAGMPVEAIPYRQQAGARAAGSAAHREASGHFKAGLELLAQLPDNLLRNQLELGLQLQLGLSLSASRGYAAPEVESAYGRARELCQALGDTAELFSVLRGLCTYYIVRDELSTARELAEQCLRLGEETQRADYLIEGHTALGYVHVYLGELQVGRALLAQAVHVYRTQGGEQLTYPSVQDPAMACHCLLAIAAWIGGNAREAQAHGEAALALATARNRSFDLAYAHCFLAMFECMRRNFNTAAQHAGVTIEISQRHGFDVWLGAGTLNLAIAQAGLGQAEAAAALLTPTLAAWHAGGAELNRPLFLLGLALCQAATRAGDRALETMAEAMQHATAHEEHFFESELYRFRAELLAAKAEAPRAQIQADFQQALEIARAQKARLLELRALTSRYRFDLDTISREQLEALVRELEDECRGTVDWEEAQALLAERAVTAAS